MIKIPIVIIFFITRPCFFLLKKLTNGKTSKTKIFYKNGLCRKKFGDRNQFRIGLGNAPFFTNLIQLNDEKTSSPHFFTTLS